MSRLPETRRSIARAVTAWALLALLVGCSPATPPEQPTVRTSVGMPAGEETVTTRAGFEQRMFDEWAKGRLRFTDVAAAQKELPFALKMPDPSLVESPATIYVREASKTAPAEAHIVFGSDPATSVQLIENQSRQRENLEKQLAQFQADHDSGVSRADKMWQLVDINGNQAMAVEPGVNKPPAPLRYRNRPGVVYWWDGDVHYVVNGTRGPDGTPLPELLAIARSLR